MIRCANQDHMRGEAIYLAQKCRNDTLDLPGFMFVSAFFGDSVKLIEEEDTPTGSYELKGVI